MHKDNQKAIIRENQLDFLYDLYKRDIYIGEDNVQRLRDNNYIQDQVQFSKQEKEKIITDRVNYEALKFKNEKNREADALVDIFEGEVPKNQFEIIGSDELEKRRKDHGLIFEGRDTPIEREEWLPKSTTEHEQDFVQWVNSINHKGFHNRIQYKKFSLYCQQAYEWLSENKTSSDFDDDDLREDYRQNELKRSDENNLYFLNKYVWYKEADAEDGSGRIKYVARPVHELFAYLDDCGYSAIVAKCRQMAATTTLMAIDVRDVVFKTNHFMKFITEDDKKAVEIFEDKLKFCFSQLEDWMRPNVLNERDNLFRVGYKSEKGVKEGVGSKIQVEVPKRTAIAGGAPNKVKVDEGANIPILGQMIGNARPTMLWYNPRTKKLEVKRRIWIWATGGEMDKGGKAFETEFMAILNSWNKGDYSSCIIPLFLDWHCRPGATQADYDREKAVAYAKGNNPGDPEAKKHIVEFHQSWPDSLADVFRTSAKTLIDEDYIEAALKRIREVKTKHGHSLHQSGYFEPIFDSSIHTLEGSDVPFKIIGANFIPTSDLDARASTTIFLHPDKQWIDRYFQGTDPIDTPTGLSKFSSTIWDKYYKTTAAILNWRVPDYPQVFLQSLLLNLYYDDVNKKGTRELLEANRGTSYYQYLANKGYGKRAALNDELPDALQNRSTVNEGVGIDSHGNRTSMIVHRIFDMFKSYGDRFYHEILFEQAKTFTCNISQSGKEVWGPMNKKSFTDDVLWATVYSYICGEEVYFNVKPKNLEKLKEQKKVIYKLIRKDGKLSRLPVREPKHLYAG